VCNICRREVPIDWVHGDHIEPWSLGGRTALENCQALCGACNLKKGSQPQAEIERHFDPGVLRPAANDLRPWQVEALELTAGAILQRPVLVEACPGAGKTRFGLEVAYRLLATGEVTRVLVVAPTRGITDGWRTAAARSDPGNPSIPLLAAPRWTPVRPILDQWAGAVLTYQSLFSAPDMLMAHATDPGHRTLVIFDEVHHMSADNGWGVAAQEAFAHTARAILSLSGTAFRTDRNPIAFVRSEGGSSVPDYRYGYGEAVADKACRPVQFVRTGGRTVFRDQAGVVHDVALEDDSLNETGESKRLRAALEFVEPGSVVDFMLHSANQFLLELRSGGDHDAAGLVVTVDCDHADEIARHMQDHVTVGDRPVVACSRLHDPNDPEPGTAISQFRAGHDPWLVAVNMVSEGVDLRRLRCIVYLTNRLTDLSFRQIVGRVVRSDPGNGSADYGRVYLVSDRRLISMAESIMDDIDYGPADMIIITPDRPQSPADLYGQRSTDGSFETLATEGDVAGVSDITGTSATADLVRLAQRYIDTNGLTNTTAESLALLAADNDRLLQSLREVDS